MQFISYAQNFEDLMLWRALQHIEKGFYIDVGAAEPDRHSITKAFYLKGWHGINIEPHEYYFELLKRDRPLDINLPYALSNVEKTMEMNFFELDGGLGGGLSTLSDEICKQHIKNGVTTQAIRKKVYTRTLNQVIDEYVPNNQAIHFLKIDVEGHELEVIQGCHWKINRPWIIVVESTIPCMPIETHQNFEPLLLENDYLFVYKDGINRFYISSEQYKNLAKFFNYPPNLWDNYKLATMAELESELNAIKSSRSWKVIYLLRKINSIYNKLKTSLRKAFP